MGPHFYYYFNLNNMYYWSRSVIVCYMAYSRGQTQCYEETASTSILNPQQAEYSKV